MKTMEQLIIENDKLREALEAAEPVIREYYSEYSDDLLTDSEQNTNIKKIMQVYEKVQLALKESE